MTGTVPTDLLAARGITKRFGGTMALQGVDLVVERGEIHALVGENGAGKSTLIKILAGLFPPDEGEIRFRGSVCHPHTVPLPIHFVHQDLGLFEDLSVGENVAMIAGYPRRHRLIDWASVWTSAREIYRRVDLEPPDPRVPVHTLGAAGKAILGIVRALAHESEMLVLDEPTAALPEPDAQRLFEVLRRLREAGTGMLYVSHRLSELFPLVDSVTVFRDGRRVKTASIHEYTHESLIADMLGRRLDDEEQIRESRRLSGEHALRIRDLKVGELAPVNFDVRRGEILGLVGLRGAGQDVIGRALFGAVPAQGGKIELAGRELPSGGGVAARIAAGISLLPGDRTGESVLPGMSIRENLFPNPGIEHESAWRIFSPKAERRKAVDALERFDVRPPNSEAVIDWLSGGNQQKVFVGRWLSGESKVVILEEPSAGVDVGAKVQIHQMIRDIAGKGAGVIVVSSDFEEVATVCHRALVIRSGSIAGSLEGGQLTVDGLLSSASSSDSIEAPALEEISL